MVLIALAAGIFLLIRSESHGFNFYAGIISLGVAAVWTLQFAAATARRHVANIFVKLNVPNRAAATRFCMEHGLDAEPAA